MAEKFADLKPWPIVAMVLVVLMWTNINAGPWNMSNPEGAMGMVHAVRAALPLLVLPVGLVLTVSRRGTDAASWCGPARLLAIYGIVAAAAAVLSPNPVTSLYWAVTFLACILAGAEMLKERRLSSAATVVILTWCVAAAVALIIAAFVKDDLVNDQGQLAGYNSFHKGADVGGMGMSRSSGVTRFSAVPATIAFSMLWFGKSKLRFLWLAPWAGFTFIIIAMQSRGGLFGYVAALAAVILLHRARTKVIVLIIVLVGVAVLADNTLPATVSEYLHRGEDDAGMVSMTGRTRAWAEGWEAFKESPVIGAGHWADRMIIGEHVHNAFMQALLSAGLIGLIPYTASWVVAWIMFVRCLKRRESLPPLHRMLLIQCGAILTFFTVRSIPETTTASFSVDLLVMVPVMMYLEILDRQLRNSPGGLMEGTSGGLGDRQPQRTAAMHFKQLRERIKVET
jgi:O-antigen ligase